MNKTPQTRYKEARFWEGAYLLMAVGNVLGLLIVIIDDLHPLICTIPLAGLFASVWLYHKQVQVADFWRGQINTSGPHPDR